MLSDIFYSVSIHLNKKMFITNTKLTPPQLDSCETGDILNQLL